MNNYGLGIDVTPENLEQVWNCIYDHWVAECSHYELVENISYLLDELGGTDLEGFARELATNISLMDYDKFEEEAGEAYVIHLAMMNDGCTSCKFCGEEMYLDGMITERICDACLPKLTRMKYQPYNKYPCTWGDEPWRYTHKGTIHRSAEVWMGIANSLRTNYPKEKAQ